MSTETPMQATAKFIADTARFRITLTGESPQTAVDETCRAYIKDASHAEKRTGRFSRETSSEELERWGFIGAVASDILDGTVTRPSTGNVRAFVLNLLSRTATRYIALAGASAERTIQ